MRLGKLLGLLFGLPGVLKLGFNDDLADDNEFSGLDSLYDGETLGEVVGKYDDLTVGFACGRAEGGTLGLAEGTTDGNIGFIECAPEKGAVGENEGIGIGMLLDLK